jgi:DNA-binding PadR family transcriptional regulator
MSLDHAILGFLTYRPYTGYDLKKIFDTSVRHFWPAHQSQIYRTLNRLSENGFVEMEKVEQENRPARKQYTITEEGRRELHRWMTTPLPFGEYRSAAMIQVFFAGQLSNQEIVQVYRRAADFIRQGLEQYDQIPKQIEAYSEIVQSPRDFFFWMQTLEIGMMTARTNLEWIVRVIEQIEAGEIPEI